MIELPANVLRAALVFSAKNDVRYYLNGVYVDTRDPNRLDIVSTDGHCMFVHRAALKKETPEELRREWILQRDDLIAITRKCESLVLLGSDKESATVRPMGGRGVRSRRQLIELIDGRFPLWEPVFSKAFHAKEAHSFLNPLCVGTCAKAEKLLCGFERGRTTIATKGDDAAVVTFPDDLSMGLIMPMRHLSTAPAAWAKAIPVFEDEKKTKLREAA